MILYPAIDLKDGRCVRRLHGDLNKETVFNNSPADQAALFHWNSPKSARRGLIARGLPFDSRMTIP